MEHDPFQMRQGQLVGELEQLRAQLISAQEHGTSQAQVGGRGSGYGVPYSLHGKEGVCRSMA